MERTAKGKVGILENQLEQALLWIGLKNREEGSEEFVPQAEKCDFKERIARNVQYISGCAGSDSLSEAGKGKTNQFQPKCLICSPVPSSHK